MIRKEPLGPDAQRRLQQELAMLKRLRGVAGVAQLVEDPQYPGAVSLADVGGRSAAAIATPMDADVLIGLGSALARTVAEMHSRRVMHRDITPGNIVISPDGVPWLVDFALATTFAAIRPAFTHHSDIVGTLAYLAPEQTGRTGRPVDHRADLYALGATLYELATGAPPFGFGNPLRLTHDHLARVPVPPAEVNPAVPGTLSEIILHLLEKEPDNRYQTAEGVHHDLQRLIDAGAEPTSGPDGIGQHDVPLRLLPPSRLVGRDTEVATLQTAFGEALAGRCRAVLVGGAPGIGKTALVDELRPVVTRAGGWFVAGKFDQYRRDLEASGVYQAFRALGRLLLAEKEDELARVRERIRAALGANAGLMAAIVPEYAALLTVPPDPGDPMTAQVRGQRNGVQIVRAVASPHRPIVLFLDDLHWAGRTPSGFVDLLLEEEPIEGLLLVGTYRDNDRKSADPLSRWLDQAGVRHLRLANLPVPSLVTMIAEMLHVDPVAAADLAEVVESHTSGNPYETVELLNALRRDGVLTVAATGWRWNPATVRRRLNRPEAGSLPATPVAVLPAPTRQLVEAVACLGGRATVDALRTATGTPAEVMQQRLAPAFGEGVLIVEPGADEAVRFRHDRLHESILRGLDKQRQRQLRLTMARRLARVPELSAVAAEQYLAVADAIDEPAERRRVVDLLRGAADRTRPVGDHALVSALLGAALPLVDQRETATLVEIYIGRQSALYSLGRLEEADEDYLAIEKLGPTAAQRADAAAIQVRSLTNRNRFGDALELGVDLLRELGIAVPADRSPAELEHQLSHLDRWLEQTDIDDDLERPEITDPTLVATCRLIAALVPVAYFVPDFSLFLWLSLEGPRIWLEHGPGQILIGLTGVAANAATAQHTENYAAGYRALRRIIAVGEARAYEPETSLVRSTFASVACCWFEPIENAVRAAQEARQGLIAGGDLAWAGYAYQPSAAGLLECAPTLDVYVAEVDAGLAFVRRTGNEQTGQWLDSYRWLADVFRGEGSDGPAAVGDPIPVDRYAGNPAALLYGHIARSIAMAVFDDPAGLAAHAAAAMQLLAAAHGLYPTAIARLMYGLALAEQARAADDADRDDLLSKLNEMTRWLSARATDAPDNFLHMLHLLEAERGWAVGDFRAAVLAFDAALRVVDGRNRPWHRALIAERAARFHLIHGAEHASRLLLAQAREAYAAWGASAKVVQLDWAYPRLGAEPGTPAGLGGGSADGFGQRSTVTTGTLDLLGILSASQALSSETSIERLHARVVEVLSAMTGATGVRLLLRRDDHEEWVAPAGAAGQKFDAPMSVLRYVQRVPEPLLVDDVTRDDRFARDPYFIGVAGCSLLALPVLGRGTVRAVLLLENRLIRGAFTADRLDAVKLITAQLTVSLDNAQLYAELTSSRARIVAASDQTRRRIERDLHDGAQQRLANLAIQARLALDAVPGSDELTARLRAVIAEANKAMAELRELARGIHPAVLAEGGLRPAIRALARRSRVPVELRLQVEGRLPEQVEIATYFTVAEALTNTAKHAGATAVTVALGVDDAVLRIRVSDDGRGGADLGGGSGLAGLKDRIQALGGRFAVHTVPGDGTTVHAELPLSRPGPAHG
ncbi:AAA family ATPase [Actinoplanes sp. NPDC051343]|uniref:AAA family ATPase n=1 Tax=Actinoplanes sp. NPDC051343 TaxID=3363906 RepID=UPI00379F9FBD